MLYKAARFLASSMLATLSIAAILSQKAAAQPVIAAQYASSYSLVNLGQPSGVPGNYGGLTLLAGDPNTLLLGGAANDSNGAIYSVGVTRTMIGGLSRISSFSPGVATQLAAAPFIDGGLAYGPGGVLFATTYSNNTLLQYKPGSTTPDKTIDLTALGIASSTGTIQFTPGGRVKIASYNSANWYDVTLTPDGTGTYDVSSAILATTITSGPEGIVYVPNGSPLFFGGTVLVAEYQAGRISAYDLDNMENPILSTCRDFITGLSGAEGGYLDRATGDFLFSTFGNNGVYVVRGLASSNIPEPTSLALLLPICTLFGCVLRVRRRTT